MAFLWKSSETFPRVRTSYRLGACRRQQMEVWRFGASLRHLILNEGAAVVERPKAATFGHLERVDAADVDVDEVEGVPKTVR